MRRIFALISLVLAGPTLAQDQAAAPDRPVRVVAAGHFFTINLAKGEAQLLRTATPFANLVVGDPKVVAANPFGDRTLSVQAMDNGLSTILFLDADNNIIGEVQVTVGRPARRPAVTRPSGWPPPAPAHVVRVRAGNWGPLSLTPPAHVLCDWRTGACEVTGRGPGLVPAAAPGPRLISAPPGPGSANGPCRDPDDIAADGTRCGDRAASRRNGGE